MQYFSKEKAVFVLVVSGLILSVFMLLVTPNTIANVSAVEANGVGVYWDGDCTDRVFSIDWGNLTPGSSRSIVVYIRNEVEEQTNLFVRTQDWNPSKASQHITLWWDHSGQRVNPNETLEITFTLSVSNQIEGISSFSFDIIITASDSLPGDINGDGTVDVLDVVACGLAFGSRSGDPYWNPDADLNNDGTINIVDITIVGVNFGIPRLVGTV